MKLNKLFSDSLFSKIFIRFILISLIVILIFGSALIYYFKSFFFNKREEEIIKNTTSFIEYISQSTLEGNFSLIENWIRIVATINEGQAWLIDENGYLVMSYPFNLNLNSQVIFNNYEKIFEGKIISQRVETRHFDNPMLLVGMPVNTESSPNYGLLIFTSVAGINSTINQIQKIMLYISLVAVILTLITSYFWSKSLSTPLKKISETALKLSEGNLGKTVDVKGEDEISVVADSLNYLSNALKNTVGNLKQEKNKLSHVLKGMNEGVIVFDIEKNIILSNESAKELLEVEQDLENNKLDSILLKKEILNFYVDSIKNNKTSQMETSINNKKRIIIYSSPIYDENDKFWGTVSLIRDISERWRFEKMQKEFMTNVSHELKTPLSSIKGAGEVLNDGIIADESRKKEYYQMIVKEANRLEEMVENILNISKLEEKSFSNNIEKIDIEQLFKETVLIFKEKTDINKNFNIKKPKNNIKINVNKNQIKQALINLLDNSLKFSKGNIEIELGAKKEGSNVKIWVKDKGIGIDEEELKNIWERFYQVDKSRTPKEKGTGLGLSIVKRLIELNNGSVYVESKPNQGSEFGFYLPLIEKND